MAEGRTYGCDLFVHAGVDDEVTALLRTEGIEGLNARFRQQMSDDLFALYHGSVGNSFRTKYRDTDRPLTESGVRDMHAAGLYAIVHGHQSIPVGQRFVFRAGLLNVECDCSVDAGTREVVGLAGPGAAVTTFRPDGRILGISMDHPHVKVFDATDTFPLITLV